MNKVENYGRILSLTIPDGWSDQTFLKESEIDPSLLRKFVLDENNDVQICLYTRNLPISFNSCNELRKLLAAPCHELTPREQILVQEVLEGMSSKEAFQALSIRTESIDGINILVAEGRWIRLAFDTLSFFVDVGGKYAVVQQIYFAAPRDAYLHHLAQAKAILYSIKFTEISTQAEATT
ncbi:hypothetical protein BH10CYA1_BH10CYA1_32600 [soil metagenome]